MRQFRIVQRLVVCVLFVIVHKSVCATEEGRGGETQPSPKQNAGGLVRRIMGPGDAPKPFPEASEIAQPKNEEELSSAIKKLATRLAGSGHFSGSIFLAANGNALVNQAWGEADRAAKTANTTDTAYDVGSIGKLFTQVAILQLEKEGKLGLDDTFGKYLTDYPNGAVAGKVTVRELLLHTSGIPDFFSHVTPAMKLDSMVELKDFLPLFARQPLDFEPGSGKRYSSSGYVVLGLIVEAVSKEKYFAYVQRHILQPAGMNHSGFFNRSKLPPLVAHSYEGGEDVTGMHPRQGSPAGGLQASAGDLFRLVQAINAGKLIKPEAIGFLQSMIPRPPGTPPPADGTKLTAYGIDGGAPGVSAQVVIDPTGHYTRVVLCNEGPPMAQSMGATIREWISHMPK